MASLKMHFLSLLFGNLFGEKNAHIFILFFFTTRPRDHAIAPLTLRMKVLDAADDAAELAV